MHWDILHIDPVSSTVSAKRRPARKKMTLARGGLEWMTDITFQLQLIKRSPGNSWWIRSVHAATVFVIVTPSKELGPETSQKPKACHWNRNPVEWIQWPCGGSVKLMGKCLPRDFWKLPSRICSASVQARQFPQPSKDPAVLPTNSKVSQTASIA